MKTKRQLTSIIRRDNDGFVSLCPEIDIASQGDTVEEAEQNLKESVELFLECADADEVSRRLSEEVHISHFEASYAPREATPVEQSPALVNKNGVWVHTGKFIISKNSVLNLMTEERRALVKAIWGTSP